jgi:TfoX/Sxy family transcriptional regulator of competence genes
MKGTVMGGMGAWKKAPPELVKTFEEVLGTIPGAQPRRMFGYPSAFVNGQMFTGLFQDRMFVRLSEAGRAELAKQGGKPFEPMSGRPMREYAEVPASMLRSKTALVGWVRRAFDYAASLPAKGPSKTKSPSTAKPAGKAAGRKGRL